MRLHPDRPDSSRSPARSPRVGALTATIAWRYLRGERSRILSATALAAWAATALGVTAMVVTMALMTGYTEDLQRKLVGLQGEVVISPLRGGAFERDQAILEQLAATPETASLRRIAYGEGSISSSARKEGVSVVLRGVERTGSLFDGRPSRLLEVGEDGIAGVLLGRDLAASLNVDEGDLLRLVVLDVSGARPRFEYLSVRCRGTFAVGFAEFDSRWILLDRDVLIRERGEVGLDLVELELHPSADSAAVAERAEELLGEDWLIQRWEHLNRDLFAALALQKLVLFVVLGLIVLVSTFNIASTLMILVRERLSDIGVLGALGMTPSRLQRAFLLYGAALGTAGIATGLVAGTAISWCVTTFDLIRFPPEVAEIYFIDSVPFRVAASDLLGVGVFSTIVTLLACALPARRAARMKPAAALRDE